MRQQCCPQGTSENVRPDQIVFEANRVFDLDQPELQIPFTEVVRKAHGERMSLSARPATIARPIFTTIARQGRGRPFFYFAFGAAVSEVEVDGFTGMMQLRRVDILHDAGCSINAGMNRGQIEGGFVQGMGWLTCEELKWDEQGRLLTHSPDTYKIPAIGDTPLEFQRGVPGRFHPAGRDPRQQGGR